MISPFANFRAPYTVRTFVDCDEIEPGLYLGNMDSATCEKNIKSLKITHLLSAYHLPVTAPANVKTLYIPVADCEEENILTYFHQTNEFIKEGQSVGACLVHCYAGVSRSATCVIAYLMHKYGVSFQDAKSKVKHKRNIICPNPGFTEQLLLYESMGRRLDPSNGRYRIFLLQQLSQKITSAHDYSDVALYMESAESRKSGDTFKCRQCRHYLFSEENLVLHPQRRTLNWRQLVTRTESVLCMSTLFVEALPWISNALTSAQGKIYCPKCQSKIGTFSWSGEPCLCGAAIYPSFKVITGKVDRIKAVLSKPH